MAKKKAAEKSSLLLRNFEPYKEKRGEPYMNEKQRDHFRTLLLEWKQDLMAEVDRTVSHMKDDAANFPDPADRATQEEEFSLELRTRDRERKLIKKIDKTIEMIDAHHGVEQVTLGRGLAVPEYEEFVFCVHYGEVAGKPAVVALPCIACVILR